MSSSDTDFETFCNAARKSDWLTGNSSFSFGKFLISSAESPCIQRLITIIDASLQCNKGLKNVESERQYFELKVSCLNWNIQCKIEKERKKRFLRQVMKT